MANRSTNTDDLKDALERWGLTFEVNQAGPLLEQMAQQWEVRIDKALTSDRYIVSWRGEYGAGNSVLAAALDCLQIKHRAMQ
jgi:hypothetical protein